MDQSLSPGRAAPNLPAQTASQFLAQLPELALEFLSLSSEFESGLGSLRERNRLTEGLRGWGALEKLARESLIERGRQAASSQPAASPPQTISKPFVPARRLARSLQQRAGGALNETFTAALEDPRVMDALMQWTRGKNSKT